MKLKGIWTNYHSGNCPMPSGSFVSTLIAGMDGRVWINIVRTDTHLEDGFEVTEGKTEGILVFYQEQWTFHSLRDLGIFEAAHCEIACDGKGYLWMYAASNSLYRFDGQNTDSYHAGERGLPADLGLVCAFATDEEGVFWMAIVPGGLYRFDEQNWKRSLPEDNVDSERWVTYVFTDSAGRLWCAVQDDNVTSFLVYENENWKEYASLAIGRGDETVQAMAVDQQGVLWVGWGSLGGNDTQGLWRLERKGTAWQQYTVKNSPLADNHIKSITLDPSGRIWVGTIGGFVVFDGDQVAAWEVILPGTVHGPLTEKQAREKLQQMSGHESIHIGDYATVDTSQQLWVRSYNGISKFSET